MADLHRGRSVRALASVGSFLGLQHQDETLNQWKHSTEERAKVIFTGDRWLGNLLCYCTLII